MGRPWRVSVLATQGRVWSHPSADSRLIAQLAKQTRNRDHDSSDPCGEAKKQQKVTQEHRHKPPP